MIRVFTILGRLSLMLIAYGAAVLVSSIFFHVVSFGVDGLDPRGLPPVVVGAIFVSVPVVALFMAYFGLFPTIILVGLGEILAARDWLFYAIGGGIVGVCTIGLAHVSTAAPYAAEPEAFSLDFFADPSALMALIGTGMVGGIAYWLIAGRMAGDWRAGPRQHPTSQERSGF